MNSQRGIAKKVVATLVKLTNGDCVKIINVRPSILLMQLADSDQDDIMDAYPAQENFLIRVPFSKILYVCLSEELVPRPMPPTYLEQAEARQQAAIIRDQRLEALRAQYKAAIRPSPSARAT